MIAERERTFSADERLRLRSDFRYFCETLLKINPKIKELVREQEDGRDPARGPLIPFRWNKAQGYVWAAMCERIDRGLPVKLVILKARQVGISTFFCAYIFWQMWRQMNYRAAVVAFEAKTTLAELNETMATFYDGLPDGNKPKLRQHHKNARVAKQDTPMYFDDRKAICNYVVQKPNALRGVARDGVLTTEVAFFKKADEFYGGFLPAMSDGPNAFLVLESSPEDGYFKDAYDIAVSGETDRIAIFIPWWMCDDLYTRKLERRGSKLFDAQTGDRVVIDPRMRKKQRALSRMAIKRGLPSITDEQIWWWLWKCASDYQGDEEWMQQEFPDDDVTAFQRASRSAFKAALPMVNDTVKEIETIFPDMAAGVLRSLDYTDPEIEDHVVWFEPEKKDGWIDQERRPGLLMLEPPKPGYTYVLGADVADEEGEDDEEGERAFSVACIYCCDTRDQVAEWRGHIDPYDWGDEIVKLGFFYNTAMLVVERNNMGRLTEHRIKELRYPFHRVFRWPDFNTGMSALTKKTMWETNASTKPLMIGMFRKWVRDGMFRVRTPGLQDEMQHYTVTRGVFTSNERPADRIIAASLCCQGVMQTGFGQEKVLGAPPANRSAHGAAIRGLRLAKPSASRQWSEELPEEFGTVTVTRVQDIFAAGGL